MQNGTTAITDINASTAKVYYTGSSTTFSTATLFESATPTIADFNVTGTQVLGQGDNYFWLAYDVIAGATTGNLIDGECNSVTVGSAFTPSVTNPVGNKSILGPLSGTYNIGALEVAPNYTTITNAVSDLNNRGVNGPVIFLLKDSTYSGSETFPISLNAFVGASPTNTATIKPNGSMTPTISGAVASGCLIRLNGADYVTIDGSNSVGGTTRDLTLTNTSTTSPATVCLQSLGTGAGATNDTVKNTNISTGSNAATSYGIFAGSATVGSAGDDNDNLTIQNNSITKAYYGIRADANATGVNNGLVITGNSIGSLTAGSEVLFSGISLAQATERASVQIAFST
ncbi:MAG: hypothetical protein IPK58_19315 [Acidobacteria bacterium]|nr:hypothetical protein [Acidobacteriota bacterium]